jgi:hypothetical protein
MAPKLAKMARDRKREGHVVTNNRPGHTIAVSNHLTAEIAKACEGYTGVVTVGDKGRRLRAIGKQRREFDGRTFGNGERQVTTARDYYDLWDTSDRLIRNGVVVG